MHFLGLELPDARAASYCYNCVQLPLICLETWHKVHAELAKSLPWSIDVPRKPLRWPTTSCRRTNLPASLACTFLDPSGIQSQTQHLWTTPKNSKLFQPFSWLYWKEKPQKQGIPRVSQAIATTPRRVVSLPSWTLRPTMKQWRLWELSVGQSTPPNWDHRFWSIFAKLPSFLGSLFLFEA